MTSSRLNSSDTASPCIIFQWRDMFCSNTGLKHFLCFLLPHPAVIHFAICHLPVSCVDLTVSAIVLLICSESWSGRNQCIYIHEYRLSLSSRAQHDSSTKCTGTSMCGGQKIWLSQHGHWTLHIVQSVTWDELVWRTLSTYCRHPEIEIIPNRILHAVPVDKGHLLFLVRYF